MTHWSPAGASGPLRIEISTATFRGACRRWLLTSIIALLAGGNALAQGPRQFAQQAPKLVATDAVGNAFQGTSLSLSADGSTAIVGGANDDSNIGAAWIWTRSGDVWTQQGFKLVGSDAVGDALQGASVSLSADGNTALVGGYRDNFDIGAVWVWTRTAGVWAQQGPKLVGSGATTSPGGFGQGPAVSLSDDGNTAIVGHPSDNDCVGAVWIWTRTSGIWTQQGPKLVGSGAVDKACQGSAVSLSSDGNTALVGGFNDNGQVGAAWIWTRTGGAWTQQGPKLVGSGAVGLSAQGWSAAISNDGNTAIVGGDADDSSAGAVWVFTRSGGVWTQQGTKLVGSEAVGMAAQGRSVSLAGDGNTLIAGGPADNNFAGAAWVWMRAGGVWTELQPKLIGSDAEGTAVQGGSVALAGDGNTAMAGSNDNSGVGAAWVFSRIAGVAPTSLDDSYTASFNTALTVVAPGVLSNDTSSSGESMTAELISTATSGTLTFNTDGGFTFQPAIDFSGPVTFAYRATSGGGNGAPATVTITVAEDPSILRPPTNLFVSSMGGNMLTIAWTAPASGVTPTSYMLEGGVSPGETLAGLATGSAATAFTFAAPTGAFYIRVHAGAPGLRSAASNEIRIFVNVPVPPSAPANLLGFVNNDAAGLAWANTFAGGTPTGLILDVAGSAGLSIDLPVTDTFSSAGVPPGTYTVSMRAYNTTGVSASSNSVTLTFPGACSGAPNTPTSFRASKSGNVIGVSWRLPASGPAPIAYSLIVTGTFVANLPLNVRSISGAVAPGTYNLSVVATNPCGSSTATTAQTVTIP